jgi:TolB-like protein/Tfp pilus assembly protein PilF
VIGTTLAHYRITGELGAGGMGEVWRAEDTKLGRDVALKVLSEEFADDAERLQRFEREARAVAALSHPHIVTIFSVEEADGVRFLTMELIEGRSLDKLIPDGGLDLAMFLELATPLAEAISAAHDKSVIHRDLKPSNVMVDGENRVKVLDFGLAKVRGADGGSDSSELLTEALTGIGTLVGTVPYMSPEQIEGKIVDHRTDIFSLGALLYEMATGERPFSGESQPALMSSILKDVPQSVLEVRNDVPRHLGRIIGRCLEKDRRDRYQTARDVFNELKALRREFSSRGVTAVRRPEIESISARTDRPLSDIEATASTRRDEGFWVAVLPFAARAAESAVEALTGGLTEDIVTGLSRFSYLRVISRSSTSTYANQGYDVRMVGEELGARYVMEGSVRQAGPVLRVAVQLVDAESGANLWAETFNRPFSPESIFELQDDLAPRIVSTVADMNGVLPHTMSESIRSRDLERLSPYEAMLRAFGYYECLTVEDHAEVRTALERAVADAADHADCWALLSMLYAEEHKHGFNAQPDPLGRALEAARRAVALAPSSSLAYHMLAQAHFFRRELRAFRNAADRAVALNPMDGCTTAFMGILMAYAGDWDHGCALAERAMELNPHHPGWYRFSIAINKYRTGDYDGALDVALKINMPSYYFTHAALAAAYGQLGRQEAASSAVRELLALKSDFAEAAREEWGKWFGEGDLLEHMLEGLEKAGLHIDSLEDESPGQTSPSKSAASDSEGTVGIAVLPFADMSPAKDQDYFCEGMAEEIMNALVHVDGIRVASRTSAFKAVEEGKDLNAIGRALSVDQILEGSVRMAGSRMRVTAQLTEVETGYQLWSERYDREAADVFAVQDEIAAGAVKAVTSRLDSGVRTVPAREQVGNLEAYQLYLKGRHFRYSKNDHARALRCFEEAVDIDPEHAPSWVGRAEVTILASVYSLIPIREAYQTAKDSLATALDLQGESAEGRYVEGMIAFCEARWQDAEGALRRAVELQPTFVQAHCWLGFLFSVLRRREEAESAFATARELDPLAAYPYAMTACGRITSGLPREAIDDAGQAMTFDHENTLALYCSGIAKVATGEFQEGAEELETAVRHSRRGAFILGIFGWGLAAGGRIEEAEAILEELESRPKPTPTVVSEAWIRAALGDFEGAWEVLGRAEEEYQAILYFAGMPPFDPLRADPRFNALLERLGLPPSPAAQRGSPSVEGNEIAEKSIAVLPFTNMTADRDDDYFSDGLSEEIINALTRLPDLRVIARTSAFRFRGEQDLRNVGEVLGVHNVLEGSVRRAGQRLRITAQLIDVADESHIWSERFDREMTDVFEIQDEIAGAIVKKLHVSLGESKPPRRQPENVAAYEALLEGRHHFFQFTPKAAERALVCLRRALSLEPDYPDALVEHGFYHLMMAYMFADPRDALPHVRALAERALKLDPRHGEAQAAVAVMAVFWDRDWTASELLFRQALDLSPASARVHELYGLCCLLGQGRLAEALAELDRAIELDPLSALYAGNRGRVLTCSRQFAEAEESCRRGLAIDPGQLLTQVELTYALIFQGKFDEAMTVGNRAIETHGPVNAPRQALALSHALAGQRDAAMQLVSETAEPAAGYRSPLALGLVHAAFSEMDEAFAYIERSLEERDPLLIYLTVHPMFDNLRTDSRYPVLLKRMNLSEGDPT